VQSVPGEGSTFTLYLPQNYVGQDTSKPAIVDLPRAVSRELPIDANFSGKRILVVDDDMRNIFAITSVLESHGMILSHAENGKVAIEKLKDSPQVDLVLMDTMMPEMDGLQAMRLIRQMPEFSELPIISLTAKAMKGDRELCISAGASDYITKPVDANDLLTMMHSWLSVERPAWVPTEVEV
jgi:CheY-like chemotaxis protein